MVRSQTLSRESVWIVLGRSHVIYLNFLSSSTSDHQTPFEAWYEKPQSTHCLRKIIHSVPLFISTKNTASAGRNGSLQSEDLLAVWSVIKQVLTANQRNYK